MLARTVLARLRHVYTFAAVTVVMLLPMGLVMWGYYDIQRGQVAFSAKERDGVNYLRPVVQLLAETVEARHEPMSAAAPADPTLPRLIAAVDAADARYGEGLEVSATWTSVKSALQRGQQADARQQAYTDASTGLLALIVQVSDNSNLTLDPDLDSYSLWEALVFPLPVRLDLTGRAVDDALAAGGGPADQAQAARLSLARTAGALGRTQAAVDSGMATAFAETRQPALRGLQADLLIERRAVEDVLRQVDTAVQTGRLDVVTPEVYHRSSAALTRLVDSVGSQLDGLLVTRIEGLQAKAYRVGTAALAAVLLVVAVLVRFYRSIAARRRALTHAALVRQAASTANSADTFYTAAGVVLQDVCTKLGWLAGHGWTASPEPAAWFVAEHPHRHDGPCGLAASAARGAAPDKVQLPLSAQTRVASGPQELPGLGRAVRGCAVGSAVAVPVFAGGEVTGMLAFYLPAGTAPPAPDLIEILEQIGLSLGRVVERQRTAEVLVHQATHDPVTDVANRRRLLDEISTTQQQQLAARRDDGLRSAVLLINLDRFRLINDSLGYAAGDLVLREAADRISRTVDGTDLVARLGADEFVVLAHRDGPARQARGGDGDDLEPFTALAQRLLHELRGTVNVVGHEVPLRASAGICPITDDHATVAHYPAAVLRDADAALRHAKRRGKDQIQVFDAALRSTAAGRIADEAALAEAIHAGQLLLHYQPIIDLRTGLPVGVEALVRWLRPGHGMVPPNSFIPLAEDSGLIVDLGRWVLREACRHAATWSTSASPLAEATVSVNVSTRQLTHPRFLQDLDGALHDSALSADRLIVEITETALIEDPDAALATLHAIRARGVQVALDDFGTGYSSLSYVQNLPVTILKIDKSFVDPIQGPGAGTALSEVVLKLAEATDLCTVAEGVETPAQAEALRRLGCERGQGYTWSPPVPLDRLEEVVAGCSSVHSLDHQLG